MICVIGALAVDLLISRERFRKGTSNPASMRFSPGGVGYRIYSHLEGPKMLFTALGSDVVGKWLIENLDQPQGVNPLFLDQHTTACYCALMQSGELLYGAADMTPEKIFVSSPNIAPDVANTFVQILTAQTSRLPVGPAMQAGTTEEEAPSVRTYGMPDPGESDETEYDPNY